MKSPHLLRQFQTGLLALAFLLTATAWLHAQSTTNTWVGSNTVWGTSSAWSPANVPNAVDSMAIFSNSTNNTKMKKTLFLMALLSISGASAQAQTLVNVQFGGNDYGSPAAVQTGAGLIGSTGDVWNDYLSTSALTSGVNVLNSDATFTGVTLTLSGSGLYQYADGVNPGNPYGANQLSSNGSSVGNLASGELGANPSLTLSLTGLSANTTYSVYLLSSPDRWERSSSWSVNGGTSQTVGPLNSYNGPYTNNGAGWAPYEPVLGINYLQLTGTTNGLGDLTIAGTSVAGDVNINGFQLEAIAAPEPSTYALMLGGLAVLVWFQTARRKLSA